MFVAHMGPGKNWLVRPVIYSVPGGAGEPGKQVFSVFMVSMLTQKKYYFGMYFYIVCNVSKLEISSETVIRA